MYVALIPQFNIEYSIPLANALSKRNLRCPVQFSLYVIHLMFTITVMPRPKRIAVGGYVYHTLNLANGRLRIFRKHNDFLAFEQILAEGAERFSILLSINFLFFVRVF